MMALKGDDHQSKKILLLPFFGQGHLFPFMELSKHLSFLHFSTTLLLPSSLSSAIPTSLRHFIHIIETPSSTSLLDPTPRPGPFGETRQELAKGIESHLDNMSARPICAVIDIMMSWTQDVLNKFDIPIVALFTSGACSAAMEYGSWIAHVSDLRPSEARALPGLPEQMVLYLDIKKEAHHHPPPPPHGGLPPRGPPPGPGQRPHWLDEVEDTVGIMINTCHELEGPFLDYLASQVNKPVWGAGPLLPEKFSKSSDSLVHDNDIRANKQSNYTEKEVNQWLDSKPRGSTLYISFGTEVGPTFDEYSRLASALEETERPFIWVIRPGSGRGPDPKEDYYPHKYLENKVGDRGLVIHGWAPQLLILSHPSTGGFLSHCGWNSTIEAIGRGVPILAWPIRGDQHHNAKLVVTYLQVGYMIKEDESSSTSEIMKKDIVGGMQKIMSDNGIKQNAHMLRSKFEDSFPASKAALHKFTASVSCFGL